MKTSIKKLSAAAFFLLTACSVSSEIKFSEFKNYDFLVDVRTEMEFSERYIQGSILIPHDRIDKLAPEKIPDKDSRLYIFCRSGRRSTAAKKALSRLGYKNVTDLGSIENAAKSIRKKIILIEPKQ